MALLPGGRPPTDGTAKTVNNARRADWCDLQVNRQASLCDEFGGVQSSQVIVSARKGARGLQQEE